MFYYILIITNVLLQEGNQTKKQDTKSIGTGNIIRKLCLQIEITPPPPSYILSFVEGNIQFFKNCNILT